MRMKRSGRVSLVLILAIAAVVAALALFLLAGESPRGVAGQFLTALAKGDAKTLAELSYMEGQTPEQIESKWKDTYAYSKYWIFAYMIKDVRDLDKDNSTVTLGWVKNATKESSYEEKFELPMVRKDGKWKVDVRAMSREMYPYLPE